MGTEFVRSQTGMDRMKTIPTCTRLRGMNCSYEHKTTSFLFVCLFIFAFLSFFVFCFEMFVLRLFPSPLRKKFVRQNRYFFSKLNLVYDRDTV